MVNGNNIISCKHQIYRAGSIIVSPFSAKSLLCPVVVLLRIFRVKVNSAFSNNIFNKLFGESYDGLCERGKGPEVERDKTKY